MSLLRPIRDTGGVSLGLLRERLGTTSLRRLALDWVAQALTLLLVAQLVPGVTVDNLAAAFLAAIVLGLLNALVRPILVVVTLPLTVMTVGLLSLLINAVMLSLAAPLVPGLEVESVASASLVVEGLNVLAFLLEAAESGFQGVLGFGVVPGVLALAFFYYLTRPHVAAAFGRRPVPTPTPKE